MYGMFLCNFHYSEISLQYPNSFSYSSQEAQKIEFISLYIFHLHKLFEEHGNSKSMQSVCTYIFYRSSSFQVLFERISKYSKRDKNEKHGKIPHTEYSFL